MGVNDQEDTFIPEASCLPCRRPGGMTWPIPSGVPEPLLPQGKKPGRPPRGSRRRLIDGIRWRIRAGARWRDVPACCGPWQSVSGLFRRWQGDGTWPEIVTALQALADAAGHVTWDVSRSSSPQEVDVFEPPGIPGANQTIGT
jgi:hypothetical protein